MFVIIALLLASPASLQAIELYDPGLTWLDVSGDAKTFFFATYPYDSEVLPTQPSAQGAADFRLKLRGSVGDFWRFELHDNLSLSSISSSPLAPGGQADVGAKVAQTVDLDWDLGHGENYRASLRVDRALLRLRLPGMDLTLGRQPISFGSTFFFNPMDLIASFSPTVVDREYKPGIDALRSDSYFGSSGQLSLVAAYGGSWNIDDSILAARLSGSLYDVGLGLLAAQVHGDQVIGLDATTGLYGVSLNGEFTVTQPPCGQPFTRAVVGANMTYADLNVMAELYVQTLGADNPDDYLQVAGGERFARGELWAMAQHYAALSLSLPVVPIVTLGGFALLNLDDGSALLSPSAHWSVADEVDLLLGGYFGVGEHPEKRVPWMPAQAGTGAAAADSGLMDPARFIKVNSEFGLVSSTVFVEMKAYF